jgi:galactoside O-acetyltransferase
MMAIALGILEPGATLAEGTAVGAMSLIRRGFRCAPWTVYFGSPARKVGDRSKAMLVAEAALLAETQGQR